MVVTHVFNPSTRIRQVDLCKLEARLVRLQNYTEKSCLRKNKTEKKKTKKVILSYTRS